MNLETHTTRTVTFGALPGEAIQVMLDGGTLYISAGLSDPFRTRKGIDLPAEARAQLIEALTLIGQDEAKG